MYKGPELDKELCFASLLSTGKIQTAPSHRAEYSSCHRTIQAFIGSIRQQD